MAEEQDITAQTAGFGNAVRALRVRNYRVYTIGNSISLVGTWMQRISVSWLAWELTHSAVWLGMVAVADLVPTLALSPVAGSLADRVDRLWLIRLTQILAMGQAALLALFTYTGVITIAPLFALTLGLGAVNAVNQPARLALIPSLVASASLPSAVAINALVFNSARFLGPAAAGLIIERGGFALAFAVNSVSYLAFIAALARVETMPDQEAPRSMLRRTLWRDILAGYSYALQHPGIGRIIALFVVTCFSIRGFVELLPGFADLVFGRGDPTWLMATLGLGAMAGGLWMVRRPGVQGFTGLIFLHSFLMVAAVLGFVATRVYWVGLASIFLCGFSMVSTGISAQTLIQSAVDPAMRGRVLGFYGMLVRGGPAFSALLLGSLSSLLGLRLALALAALVCLLYWAWARLRQTDMEAALEIKARRAAP